MEGEKTKRRSSGLNAGLGGDLTAQGVPRGGRLQEEGTPRGVSSVSASSTAKRKRQEGGKRKGAGGKWEGGREAGLEQAQQDWAAAPGIMRFLWLGRRPEPGQVTDPDAHAQSLRSRLF